MDVDGKKVLQGMSGKLLESVEPVDLLPYLLVQDLVTDTEVEKIRNEPDHRFRMAELLSVVQNRFPSLHPLVEALGNCGYSSLAKEMEMAADQLPPVPSPRTPKGNVAKAAASLDAQGMRVMAPQDPVPFTGSYLNSLSPLASPRGAPDPEVFSFATTQPQKSPSSLSPTNYSPYNYRQTQSPNPNTPSETSSTKSKSPTGPPTPQPRKSKLERGRVTRLKQFFEVRMSGKLAAEDLKFLVQNTKFTEKQIQEWFQGFLKTCPQGRLSKEQFVNSYKEIDPSFKYTEEYCKHVFRCFDSDDSGFIDFKEFLLAINIRNSGSPRQKLEWTFRLYDIDGNGKIDLEEMVHITQTLYEMSAKEETTEEDAVDLDLDSKECALAIFQIMDRNGDGFLSMEEFVEGCLNDESLFSILTSAATFQ